MLTNVVAGMGYEANLNGDRYGDDQGDDQNNNGDGQNGNGNNQRQRGRQLEDGDSEFRCDDDAGYEDVNQVSVPSRSKILSQKSSR
jgi:hypothetical protein